jgi:hypothetical protein
MTIAVKRLVKIVNDLFVFEPVVPDPAELQASIQRNQAQTPDTPDMQKDRMLSGIAPPLLAIALAHENRIRALEGKAAITQAQFIAAVKAML